VKNTKLQKFHFSEMTHYSNNDIVVGTRSKL